MNTENKKNVRRTGGEWEIYTFNSMEIKSSVNPDTFICSTNVNSEMPKAERIANAAYIVKAVNNYEKLVNMLLYTMATEKHMDSLLGTGMVDYPERKAIRVISEKASKLLKELNEMDINKLSA